MGSAVRIPLLAGAILAATGAGPAAAAGARLWDGTVVVTNATAQCNALGDVTGNIRALYRPHLKASDPMAAVILQAEDLSHTIVIRATTNTRNLQGTAPYCGIDFDAELGESRTWFGGNYNFNVTPANVGVTTNEVRVTGTVTKFGNIPGCTLTLRAAFERRN